MFPSIFQTMQVYNRIWTRCRITVWQIKAANNNVINDCFNIAAVNIFRIAGQCSAYFFDLSIT